MAICPAMGNNLKKLREVGGWTIEAMAQKLGQSYGGYLKLERGERKLSVKHLKSFAEALGVSQSEIYADEAPIVGYVGAGSEAHYYGTAE